jgi:hypothetical protein
MRFIHGFGAMRLGRNAGGYRRASPELGQLRQHLRPEPLIDMDFRFRRSARLGPLRFNFGKSGLSSICLGGRGASFNIPIARSGGARTTVGLPGTGLSWSLQNSAETVRPAPAQIPAGPAEGLPNSRRFRSGQLYSFKQGCLRVVQEQLFPPGSQGQLLWELNLVTRLLADPSIGNRAQGLLAVIETPEAMEGYLMRAQSQGDVKRRAHRCVEAAQEAARLVNARGWLKAADLPLPMPPQA